MMYLSAEHILGSGVRPVPRSYAQEKLGPACREVFLIMGPPFFWYFKGTPSASQACWGTLMFRDIQFFWMKRSAKLATPADAHTTFWDILMSCVCFAHGSLLQAPGTFLRIV